MWLCRNPSWYLVSPMENHQNHCQKPTRQPRKPGRVTATAIPHTMERMGSCLAPLCLDGDEQELWSSQFCHSQGKEGKIHSPVREEGTHPLWSARLGAPCFISPLQFGARRAREGMDTQPLSHGVTLQPGWVRMLLTPTLLQRVLRVRGLLLPSKQLSLPREESLC